MEFTSTISVGAWAGVFRSRGSGRVVELVVATAFEEPEDEGDEENEEDDAADGAANDCGELGFLFGSG